MLATTSALCLLLPSWLMVAAFAPHWINARHRAYRSFYDDIGPGMSREQVVATLDRHYPPDGPRKAPRTVTDTPTWLGFLMSRESSRDPNCEGIFVDFAEGRVVWKHYSRD